MCTSATRVIGSQRGVFGSALIAAAAGLLAAFVLRSVLGLSMPAEIFGDRLTQLIPLPVFSALLNAFGANAKHLYLAGVLVGQGLLTALFGSAYYWARIRWQTRRRTATAAPEATSDTRVHTPVASGQPLGILDILLMTLLLWLLSAGLLAPLLGGGWFGAGLLGGAGTVMLSQLAPDLVFSALFVGLLRRGVLQASATADEPAERLSRRRLLGQGALAVGIMAGGVLLWNGLSSLLGIGGGRRAYPLKLNDTPERLVPPPQPTYGPWTSVRGQTPETTATSDFYYVSKNLAGDPTIQAAAWRLQITGLVQKPYALTYEEIQTLPATERYHTLECISNEVGGNLMSNALFRGVRLADLLNHAGIQTGASELVFRAQDGYSDSLHLSQALDPNTLLVYHLNGQPLPQSHGFPVRLLVPGVYGMKNGKWLTTLEVGAGGYSGYWEQQGWSREAVVKTTTRIDVPADGDVLLARSLFIAGVAYAGDRGISRVDVSVDGGQSWQPAILRQPLGNLTWVLWELPWQPASGTYLIVARAIDLEGNVQTPRQAPTLPDGASGYDAIQVTVR
jgi:DMSO/TMAO reductase YedYZ molybdopterin-dependent catalytic subunit